MNPRPASVTIVSRDDFVMGFQSRVDAERFLQELQALEQFGLQLHPEKTRLIEFGRFAAESRERKGQGKPETFDFLGFTHCCGKTRKGWFTIKRQSIAKRMRTTLQKIKQQLRARMHDAVADVGRWLGSVVRGWFNYHAIPGNYQSLNAFHTEFNVSGDTSYRDEVRRGANVPGSVSVAGCANGFPHHGSYIPILIRGSSSVTRGKSRMR